MICWLIQYINDLKNTYWEPNVCQASWLNFHFQETPGIEACYQGHMAETAGLSMLCSFDQRSRAHSHLLLWVPAGSWTVPSAYKVSQQISCGHLLMQSGVSTTAFALHTLCFTEGDIKCLHFLVSTFIPQSLAKMVPRLRHTSYPIGWLSKLWRRERFWPWVSLILALRPWTEWLEKN